MAAISAVLLALFSLVALSSACCTPDQWEGVESSIGGWAGRRRSGLLKEFVFASYDYTNKRSAAFLDYANGEYFNRFQIVVRYEGEVGNLYIVDLKRNKCWLKTLKRPFRQACIPEKAKSVGDYYLGLKGGFKVSGYAIEGERINAFISVQNVSGSCIPVSEAVYGKLTKVEFVQTVGFVNLTPGIKNETVFDVPAQCEKKEDFSLAEELTRDHYFFAI
ncbi:ependymin-related protein 1-like isoform X2 [Biomphalaria glabrata]|nr:ependymin-related protein 1-like isoform X2 [Biomphalaria glabrata]KAI8765495.1 ependymin-related protein 1 [Biomphalaria glabrata]